jgi:hypothetical protein
LIAAILSLGVPLVSTAGGAPGPPQAGAAQTTNSAKSGDNQAAEPAKDDEETSDEPVQAGQPPATQPPEQPGGATTDQPVQAGQPAAALPPGNTGDTPPVEPAQAVQPPAAPAVPSPDHAAEIPPTDSVSEGDDSTLTSTASTPKQQQLQKDTAKLLQLVRELRVDVDKAGKDQLSVAAVRKANEIQKLAKDLGERMRELEQVPGNRP